MADMDRARKVLAAEAGRPVDEFGDAEWISVRTALAAMLAFAAERPGVGEGRIQAHHGSANSHIFDDQILIGGECIAFSDEPWTSKIVAALSVATPADDGADFSRITMQGNLEKILSQYRDAHPRTMLQAIMSAIPRLSAPPASPSEGEEGPRPLVIEGNYCSGCKHLKTEFWSEPHFDDRGTSARCGAMPDEHGGKSITAYWSKTTSSPSWCPFLPAALSPTPVAKKED